MSNYKFKLLIKPESIFNKLTLEQRQQFSSVEITKATLFENGTVELDCLALDSEIIETPYIQILSNDNDTFICVEQPNDIYKDADEKIKLQDEELMNIINNMKFEGIEQEFTNEIDCL